MAQEIQRNKETQNPPTQEVEIRCLLTPQQHEEINAVLLKGEAVFLSEEHITDVYFCPVATKSFQEIEMDEVGSYSVRLRDRQGGNNKQADLNVKVITNKGDHNAWDEHEIIVSSVSEAQKILTTLGFKPYFMLEKHRTSFGYQDMTVILENIKDFGYVMEVEILTDRQQAENAKDTIRTFMKQSGIQDSQIVPKSVTNILMQQNARF